jgi:hypothetical protein
MDHQEIKHLFNYLESNNMNFTRLQSDFVVALKIQYKVTGLLTPMQSESLLDLKEKVNSIEGVAEPEFNSSMYSQLQENLY